MSARLIAMFVLVLVSLSGCQLMRPPAAPVAPAVAPSADYRLGIGDIISIRIFGGEEDMRFERVRLNHPGTITLPFGEITALEKTTRELEAEMTKGMRGKFLRDPKVWVNIEEYRPFFVQGQVNRPGAFAYQPGLNVSKAVTIAGGFRERASREKIFLIREADKANASVRVDMSVPVGPGDTIIVEESLF